jgi:hypothetical protein
MAGRVLLVAAVLAASVAVVAPADADDGGAVVVSSEPQGRGGPPTVEVGVATAGGAGRSGGVGRPGAVPVCRYVPDPDMEAVERGRGVPTVGAPPVGARLYARLCGGVLDGWVWLAGGRAAAAAVSPEAVAVAAYGRLRLPAPVIATSPPLWAPVLVRVPVWLWVDRAGWGPRSASAAVPGLSVRAVATPVRVRWVTGDGGGVVCSGPGAVFRAGVDDPYIGSPDCGHVWVRSSAGLPGEAYVVTATVVWRVRWAGGGRVGVLPELSSSGRVRLRAAESQAVNEGVGSR